MFNPSLIVSNQGTIPSGDRIPPDRGQSFRRNVTLMFTRNSVTFPPVTMIFCSLIQAPWIPSSVFEARAIPDWIASSKLLGDVAVISTTFATDTPAPFPNVADITTPFSKKVYRREFLHMCTRLDAGGNRNSRAHSQRYAGPLYHESSGLPAATKDPGLAGGVT